MLGVVQEQHAERCRLFADWQQWDWPILHDPINSLGCRAVPITLAIDELGVVRNAKPSPEWLRNEFLASTSNPVENRPPATDETSRESARPNLKELSRVATQENSSDAWRGYGDAVMLWEPNQSTRAVDAYREAIRLASTPELHFRLGVALRHRFESSSRQRDDFTNAVKHWRLALRGDPNQYIWRRRIQQYGPRLDKPYPFYDWIDEAIQAITQRDGKPPRALRIPLSGAELASPLRQAELAANSRDGLEVSPDPTNRIHRDLGEFVHVDSTLVASSNSNRPKDGKRDSSYRLHLHFQLTGKAMWNNESEPLQVWLERSEDVSIASRRLRHDPQVTSAESDEVRVLDVEFSGKAGLLTVIRGFALYTICEKSTQQCILRRQDFRIPIRID